MACYHPIKAWYKKGIQPSFKPQRGYTEIQLPCSQCIGCRLERSRQWATRCIHEANMHTANSFVTLTYDDENIPYGGTLVRSHFQKFMKRLRSRIAPRKVRFFMCGEYGSQLLRPHYHALLFGHDWDDKQLWQTEDGMHTYTSATLESLWPYGFSTTGDITWQSAAYVSRYVIKKQTGKAAKEHYERIIESTGEIIQIEPEYITMSLKPAIGKTWFEAYSRDCYPKDFISHRGKKLRVPKYYDTLLERDDPKLLDQLKEDRKRNAWKWFDEQSTSRLRQREACAIARTNQLTRTI